MIPIAEVAARSGIDPDDLEPYGRFVAKLPLANRPPAATYVLVTALTPTPSGEGKTTTAIGLAQGLARLGHQPVLTLRQPSLGPTFGIKGGAAGRGRSQIVPSDRVNLHLTGDSHAVTAAHNLLAAMVDNHVHHGNGSGLDPRRITWPRVVDANDRALRHVVIGLGDRRDGVPRQSSFDITAASEIMAILALARDDADLRQRLVRIVVGYRCDGTAVTAGEIGAAGAMAVLLRDALRPNLLQTSEGTPALMHTGPFGNISLGNSSAVADLVAAGLGDYLITEAGFGSDLGAERLVNVKSRVTGLAPQVAVLVATVRALKVHGRPHEITAGAAPPPGLAAEDPAAVRAGLWNLDHHLRILRHWGVPTVIAVNAFPADHPSEHAVVLQHAADVHVPAVVTTHVADGGAGAERLARVVVENVGAGELRRDYDLADPLVDKITAVATQVYGASGIDLSRDAECGLAHMTDLGYGDRPVIIAKTHLSPTHEQGPVSAGWRLPVREVRLAAGAGYVVAMCGTISTMPGLPAHPAAEQIDLDSSGSIIGLR